jgi:phage protein D
MGASDRAGSVGIKVSIGGTEVPDGDLIQFTVDKDVNQPDQVVVVLRNSHHKYSNDVKPKDPIEVKVTTPGNNDMKLLFTGTVKGQEPDYKAGGESRCTIRGYCTLHDKLTTPKTRTFPDKNDQQILTEVLGQIDFKGPDEKPTYKHVYQTKMSDLDFARQRAARMGCHIWNENGKIMVKKPELDKDSGVDFAIHENQDKPHRMKSFRPRLSGSQTLKSYETTGWDPEKKEIIQQKVKPDPSPLGNTEASQGAGDAGEGAMGDEPFESAEEAKMVAKAKIQEHNLKYMTAEAEAFGNPAYMPGMVIKISVNSQASDKFDGKYYVMGVTHKYSHGTQTNPDGGYTTFLRLARNAEVQ